MNEVESFHCLPPFDHAGDVDLTCTLADHFDIDISLCKGLKHPPCDTHHVRHLFAYEGQDSHVTVDGDLIHSYLSVLLSEFQSKAITHRAALPQLRNQLIEHFFPWSVLDGQTHVNLARAD